MIYVVVACLPSSLIAAGVKPNGVASQASVALEERPAEVLPSGLLRVEGDGRRPRRETSSKAHAVSLTALADFEVDDSRDAGNMTGRGASASLRRVGSCKVPKHAEDVWGRPFGARSFLCYANQHELQEGEACETACPKWYKTPYPTRVWCSCDDSGEACSLQPVADSADVAPIMMNYVRCESSPFIVLGSLTPCIILCCIIPYMMASQGTKPPAQSPAAVTVGGPPAAAPGGEQPAMPTGEPVPGAAEPPPDAAPPPGAAPPPDSNQAEQTGNAPAEPST